VDVDCIEDVLCSVGDEEDPASEVELVALAAELPEFVGTCGEPSDAVPGPPQRPLPSHRPPGLQTTTLR
jgi:hypothetical protein